APSADDALLPRRCARSADGAHRDGARRARNGRTAPSWRPGSRCPIEGKRLPSPPRWAMMARAGGTAARAGTNRPAARRRGRHVPKVAMVTGGNRGIGLGITTRLLDEGYAVAILATREEPAELMAELRERGEAIYVRGSISELGDHRRYLDATLERWGRVDILVHNAGVAPTVRDDILVATPESYDRAMDINLRGPYFLTQLVARTMVERRGEMTELPDRPVGTIVNVSSTSAVTVSTNRGEYCISKAGMAMSTQLWAARLAPEGIVVYEI